MRKILFFVILVLLISLVNALKDFDNDGIPDSWEKKYNLKYDVNDANEDPDNDGLTNLQEYEKGSNPLVSDVEKSFFAKIFGFLGENIIKILLGIAGLVILYFTVKIIREFFILKKKIKYKLEKIREPPEEKRFIQEYVPLHEKRILEERKIGDAFSDHRRKKKKIKRKYKERARLTEVFEETKSIEEGLEPLPYSFSMKIRKIKELFYLGKKPEKQKKKKTVFDRLPKRK